MQLLETIRFENGNFENLDYHQKRMNNSRKELFGCLDKINLVDILQAWTLELNKSRSSGFAIRTQNDVDLQSTKTRIKNLKEQKGLFKCRITYSDKIEKIEFISYQLSKIHSLQIVIDNEIDYSHKYLNRSRLDQLYKQKGNADDILIVKNGLVTDTWFANVIFFDGKNWFTPQQPLLKGTQRQKLLNEKSITAKEISVLEIKTYKRVRLINAMIRFEDELDIPIDKIIS